MSLLEIQLSLPLLLIFGLILILVLIDAFTSRDSKANYILSIVGLVVVTIAACYDLFIYPNLYVIGKIDAISISTFFSKNMLRFGGYTAAFDALFAISGVLTLFLSRDYFKKTYSEHKEIYSILLCSIFGMMIISHANHLIVLFLGIEAMSIPFYVLTGYIRTRESSVEGALKYFFLGAFSTGFLLYGISMIYGSTGTFYYNEIHNIILNFSEYPMYLKLGLGLSSVGILFKVAAFPFHQWAPDVYHSAPTPFSGFLSTAGKAAAIVAFIGLFLTVAPYDTTNILVSDLNIGMQFLIAVIAAATMIIGNVTALAQKNIKRMLSYSSVGHAGYLLMGIVSNNPEGFSGMLYYSIAYMLTQIGAFAVLSVLEGAKEENLMLDDFSGLSKKQPVLALVMAMFMFSLAGIPPFAGFFGKYYLFKAAIGAGFTWLTIVAVLTSIISVFYYLSVIVKMYFTESMSNSNNIQYINNKSTDKDKEQKVYINNNNLAPAKLYLSKVTLLSTAIGILVFGIFSYLVINYSEMLF